jgi:ATPase subunit of ABC transporter with duplicated ATPase domains
VSSVHLSHCSFSYTSAHRVLDGVDLDIGPGWTGVVGANGAGKTTLLRLMTGEIVPDSGSAALAPPNTTVAMCPQRVDQPDERVLRLGSAWDGASAAVRARLGLDPDQLGRWGTLSPGERKRWQVGAALAVEPDVLVLDEPTNHLDADARRLLLDALTTYRGVGLVVSHDRALLDELTTTTIWVRRGGAEAWRGGYTAAHAAWEAAEAAERDAYEAAKRERKRTERRLHRARQDRAAAEATMKREQRSAGLKDHDQRGAVRTGRVASAERGLGRAIEVLRAKVDRADAVVAGFDLSDDPGGAIRFESEPAPKEWLIPFDAGTLTAGDMVLARDLHLGVRRTDRIRVTGGNGAGKTTLLNALVAAATLPPDRVLHLHQEQTAADGAVLLERIRSMPGDARGRLLQLAAVLGVDSARLLESGLPSPGEARKLAIALGLATSVWLLVLDEPTNHLDLPSIERLEVALAGHRGALILVSHDEALARSVTTTEWRIEGGRLTVRG